MPGKNELEEGVPRNELQKQMGEIIELELGGENRVRIAEQGGTILSWEIGNKSIIPEYFEKKSGSYRGGVPVCFPFFGPAPESMKEEIGQHGWLREEKLQVADRKDHKQDNKIQQAILFGENKSTSSYPWRLRYVITHKITANSLETILRVKRLEDGQTNGAPINPAFHPYFAKISNIKIDKKNQTFLLEGGDFGLDINDSSDIFFNTEAGKIQMETNGFNKLWLWTDNQGEYGCLEPVLQAPGKFNTEEGKFLKPDEEVKFKMILKRI